MLLLRRNIGNNITNNSNKETIEEPIKIRDFSSKIFSLSHILAENKRAKEHQNTKSEKMKLFSVLLLIGIGVCFASEESKDSDLDGSESNQSYGYGYGTKVADQVNKRSSLLKLLDRHLSFLNIKVMFSIVI
jgi:hypothetical protein